MMRSISHVGEGRVGAMPGFKDFVFSLVQWVRTSSTDRTKGSISNAKFRVRAIRRRMASLGDRGRYRAAVFRDQNATTTQTLHSARPNAIHATTSGWPANRVTISSELDRSTASRIFAGVQFTPLTVHFHRRDLSRTKTSLG